MGKLRIVLGDDHTLVRQGLRKILEEQPEWEVVAEAGDGREAVRQAVALQPGRGRPRHRHAAAERHRGDAPDRPARARRPRPHPEHALRRGVHHPGAAGGRARLPAEGFRRHRPDSRGRRPSRPASRSSVRRSRRSCWTTTSGTSRDKGIVDRFESLSEREREIFQLIAEGHSNKEIADLLSISPATVETHRAHILQKLDVHNTAELVLYAVRKGIIA